MLQEVGVRREGHLGGQYSLSLVEVVRYGWFIRDCHLSTVHTKQEAKTLVGSHPRLCAALGHPLPN